MKKKPIIQVLFFVLLVVATYFVGFRLGHDQAHQRIADAWNGIFGEEAVATEMLADDIQGTFRQDQFGEDPFGPNNANDPFANNLSPFLGGETPGSRNGSQELFETNSTK